MAATTGVVIHGDDSDPATLNSAQRALFAFSFVLNGTTGRYVLADATTAGAVRAYLAPVSATYQPTLTQIGTVRLVRLLNGNISIT
jgi:hypothetical protein